MLARCDAQPAADLVGLDDGGELLGLDLLRLARCFQLRFVRLPNHLDLVIVVAFHQHGGRGRGPEGFRWC